MSVLGDLGVDFMYLGEIYQVGNFLLINLLLCLDPLNLNLWCVQFCESRMETSKGHNFVLRCPFWVILESISCISARSIKPQIPKGDLVHYFLKKTLFYQSFGPYNFFTHNSHLISIHSNPFNLYFQLTTPLNVI